MAGLTEVDMQLIGAFGDAVHQKNGSHLHGEIKKYVGWKRRWRTLTALLFQIYDLPTGVVGWKFLDILGALMTDIFKRVWNF